MSVGHVSQSLLLPLLWTVVLLLLLCCCCCYCAAAAAAAVLLLYGRATVCQRVNSRNWREKSGKK
jgi:hypothetical protein